MGGERAWDLWKFLVSGSRGSRAGGKRVGQKAWDLWKFSVFGARTASGELAGSFGWQRDWVQDRHDRFLFLAHSGTGIALRFIYYLVNHLESA